MRKPTVSVSSLLVLAVLVLVGCNAAFDEPPLEVQYRDSLVGIGKILRITNQHSEALGEVLVRIENPSGDVKNHTIASLAAGETIELGWKKLDGFEVEMGAEVTLRSTGYTLPLIVELSPDAAPSS